MQNQKPFQTFTDRLVAKVGNILILILQKFPDADRDKLLAILFLLQEYYAKHNNSCLVALEFEAWEQGPVQKDIYVDLSGGMYLLGPYIEKFLTPEGYRFRPRKRFYPELFRKGDPEQMQYVLDIVGNYGKMDLWEAVKGDGSLWSRSVQQKDALHCLDHRKAITSGIVVDFTLLFDNPTDKEEYLMYSECEAKEMLLDEK